MACVAGCGGGECLGCHVEFLPQLVPNVVSASQRKLSLAWRLGGKTVKRPRKKVRVGTVRSALQRLVNLAIAPFLGPPCAIRRPGPGEGGWAQSIGMQPCSRGYISACWRFGKGARAESLRYFPIGVSTPHRIRAPLFPLGSVLLSSGLACTTKEAPSVSNRAARLV